MVKTSYYKPQKSWLVSKLDELSCFHYYYYASVCIKYVHIYTYVCTYVCLWLVKNCVLCTLVHSYMHIYAVAMSVCNITVSFPGSQGDDSDDEDQRALSDNWKYQKKSGRWSRRILPNELKDFQQTPSGPNVVIAELRRSLGELREDSLIRSYEFTEEFFDCQTPPTSSSPPPPVGRPRSLSASQELDTKSSSEPRPRISTGSLSITPEVQHTSHRRKKLTPDDTSRQLWPISRASPYPANASGLPLVYGADFSGGGRRGPVPQSLASPLVQASCRSNSICVPETKRRSSSSLRSPSPVLVRGMFFSSQLDSNSVDSIIDDITDSATKGISRLKHEPAGSSHSRHSSLLEPPMSSEGGSSSLDLSDSLYDDGEEVGSLEGRRLDGGERSLNPGSARNSIQLDEDGSWKGGPRGQGPQGPQLSTRYVELGMLFGA